MSYIGVLIQYWGPHSICPSWFKILTKHNFKILPTHDAGASLTSLQFPSPYPTTLPRSNTARSSILSRGWAEGQMVAEGEGKKIEKQRSVTFASIDLLEPIEEDYPQESRVWRVNRESFILDFRIFCTFRFWQGDFVILWLWDFYIIYNDYLYYMY